MEEYCSKIDTRARELEVGGEERETRKGELEVQVREAGTRNRYMENKGLVVEETVYQYKKASYEYLLRSKEEELAFYNNEGGDYRTRCHNCGAVFKIQVICKPNDR